MLLRFRSFRKCLGDLMLDGDDWRCWQCGRYYYPTPPITEPPPVPEQPEPANLNAAITPKRQRSARSVNSLISSTSRSEFRWWHQNQDVITFLDQGRTVKEIASLINRGQRQIRIIRERLNDLREGGRTSTASRTRRGTPGGLRARLAWVKRLPGGRRLADLTRPR